MATRDRNADKFEQFIVGVIKSEKWDDQELGKHKQEIECPCCKEGRIQMEINTKFATVLARCDKQDPKKGNCGSHKVSMNYNVVPRTRMVDNGKE